MGQSIYLVEDQNLRAALQIEILENVFDDDFLLFPARVRRIDDVREDADRIVRSDRTLIARQRAAGAIVIGKSNMPEFGLGAGSLCKRHAVTLNES